MQYKVVIAGAGIGGLALACGLKKLGHCVTVIEAHDGYSEVNTGMKLWSFGVKHLQQMGISLEELQRAGSPLKTMIMKSSQNKVLNKLDLSTVNHIVGTPDYEIHRSDLQKCLGSNLGENAILFNHKVLSIEHTPNSNAPIKIHCSQDKTLEADILIGADGIWSTVRKCVTDHQVKPIKGDICFRGIANVDTQIVPANTHIRIYGRNKLFGVSRINSQQVRWYCTSPENKTDDDIHHLKKNLLKDLRDWPIEVSNTIEQTSTTNLISNQIKSFPALNTWTKGRVALLGDAAHPVEPTLGMGAGTAIQDAYTLFELFKKSNDIDVILKEYNQIRVPIAKRIYQASYEASQFTYKKSRIRTWWRNWLIAHCPPQKMQAITIAKMKGEY